MVAPWSPDGKQVIFWSERDGFAELYAMDSDGNLSRPTGDSAQDGMAMWKPEVGSYSPINMGSYM